MSTHLCRRGFLKALSAIPVIGPLLVNANLLRDAQAPCGRQGMVLESEPTLVSMGSDGFTLQWEETQEHPKEFECVAIGGGMEFVSRDDISVTVRDSTGTVLRIFTNCAYPAWTVVSS